jgi:glycosyltransferase involved in cell wall biosynthesis
MKISIMIPVYNEAARVERAIESVREVGLDAELIVVDDGSTDGTREILERLRDSKQIDTLVIQERNRGKGFAVRTAIQRATGDVLVIQDADLEYDPRDIPKLLEPIIQGRADAVIGSRFRGETVRVLYYWHSLGNHLLTTLSNILTNLNLTDMESGYKLMRADLAKSFPLTAERFGIEPELTARLSQSRARIYEVPINYSGRTYAEGKKIGWRDGVAALFHIIRFNLFPPRATVYIPVDTTH